jgi:hypothetical protein
MVKLETPYSYDGKCKILTENKLGRKAALTLNFGCVCRIKNK